MDRFCLTTPIYYVNDRPHIGHAYATFAADTLVRWQQMLGKETRFITGTDENASKNVEAAAKRLGMDKHAVTREQVQAYVDEMSAIWQQTWDSLDVRYDTFVRTTSPAHIRGVERFIAAVHAKDDIYKSTYAGWYCVGCEAFLPEKELDGGMCPIHHRVAERVEEENYFFRLSKYRDALLAHITANPDFVQPESRRNEVIAYITDHLEDMSISRPMRNWGIPFPGDPGHAIYVWFDALGSYITGLGYGTDDTAFAGWWPADLHLIGKEILKFHAALWPAMLMSAGLPLPKRIFATGFFTVDGEKMSKSLGNAINPTVLTDRYGIDALRYFLLKEISFGSDGDFSETRLAERYASDLQHGIGNFAARTVTMLQKYTDARVPTADAQDRVSDAWSRYADAMARVQLHEALAVIEELVRAHDRYIDDEKPWVIAKAGNTERLRSVLGNLAEVLRHVGLMLVPFLPTTAERILVTLGQDHWRKAPLRELQQWGKLREGTEIAALAHLFPPLA